MKGMSRFACAGIVIFLSAALVAPILASSSVTTGRFVQEWARTRQLDARDETTALVSLRSAGVPLGSDFDLTKSLTRADVVDLARRAGIRVTTSQPDAPFSGAELGRFFASFGEELDGENPGQGDGPGNGEAEPPFDPFTKARGLGKGKAKFSRTPTGE